MNVEIGAEAAQFPEKEYINGIAVAVCCVIIWHRDIMLTSHNTVYLQILYSILG